MIPLVFYACEDGDQECSYFIWHNIFKCILNYPECWDIVNIKKTFLPKLYSIMRRNLPSVNLDALYKCILPLVKLMPSQLLDGNLFYKDILNKMNEG
jgi:hypothetical protein